MLHFMTLLEGLTKPRNLPKDVVKKDSLDNTRLDALCDVAMVDLFNCVASSYGKSFQIGNSTSITRAREIVNGWEPPKYVPDHQSTFAFRRTYTLSQFFDRYISVQEQGLNDNFERLAAIKFLDTCKKGFNFDSYAFSDPLLSDLLGRMSYIVEDCLDEFDIVEIYRLCAHGPNSTMDVDFASAYLDVKDVSFGGTSASLQQLRHYYDWNNTLHRYLVDWSDWKDLNIRASLNDASGTIANAFVVNYTHMTTVPKKFDSRRTMCPEPTVPAKFAQGVGRKISKCLRKVGICLSTQPEVHRLLAKLGSVYPVLSIMTLDWSRASDTIWIALCERVMCGVKGSAYYDFIMNVCRTTHTLVTFRDELNLSNYDNGDVEYVLSQYRKDLLMYVESDEDIVITYRLGKSRSNPKIYLNVSIMVLLPMIGTMGNAVTFPLQTLLFYAFLTACNELAAQRIACEVGPAAPWDFPELQPVSAFGDDGITDSRALPEIEYYAELLGWELNRKKTFPDGQFRESCGGDYIMGKECRPVMLQRPPTDKYLTPQRNSKIIQSWLYTAFNLCYDRVSSLGGNASLLDEWLIKYHHVFCLGKICVVPNSYPDGSGMRVKEVLFDSPWYGDYDSHVSSETCTITEGLDIRLYHMPYWSSMAGYYGWNFKSLISLPAKRTVEQESSYYCRELQSLDKQYDSMGLTDQDDDSIYLLGLKLFDAHKVTSAIVKGEVPVKECRLHKVDAIVLSWI